MPLLNKLMVIRDNIRLTYQDFRKVLFTMITDFVIEEKSINGRIELLKGSKDFFAFNYCHM